MSEPSQKTPSRRIPTPPCSPATTSRNNGFSAVAAEAHSLRRQQQQQQQQDHMNRDQSIDALMAKEITELSLKERKEILEEIHGVSDCSTEETTELIDSRISSMDEELAKMDGKERSAYDLALRLNPEYVLDRDFRIMFLRSERFDQSKAAVRLTKHFEYKLQLFGVEKLVKNITYSDLDKEDQDALHCGCLQFLGVTDIKGRTVLDIFTELFDCASWKTFHRATWYQAMSELQGDESIQKFGLVILVFGSPKYKVRKTSEKLYMLQKGLPCRVAAGHLCLFNHYTNPTARYVLSMCTKDFRCRVRIHSNENIATCLHELQSFGINPASVPFGPDDKPQTHQFQQHIANRREQEERLQEECVQKEQEDSAGAMEIISSSSSSLEQKQQQQEQQQEQNHLITIPNDRDVLLGQIKRFRSHRGNVALDIMIDKEFPSYVQEPSHFVKTCTVVGIVQRIKERGGRFLRSEQDFYEWSVVDDSVAHDLVSARFRNRARARRTAAASNLVASSSSTATPIGSVSRQSIRQSKLLRNHRCHEN